MKLIDLNVIKPPQQAKTHRTEGSRPKGGLDQVKPSPVSQQGDQISVSNHVAHLVARAKGPDDARQLHIESLRRIVQSGQHSVSSGEIAAAILNEEN